VSESKTDSQTDSRTEAKTEATAEAAGNPGGAGTLGASGTRTAAPGTPAAPGEPRPEPIRFFGTSWLRHDRGYAWRRAGLAAGSLPAAAAGALVLCFGFQGLADANIGTLVTVLAVGGFAVCSALAFQRTWQGFTKRRPADRAADPDAARSTQSLYAIGFVGALLAYFVRCLVEAPGERLHRAEYDEASAAHDRRLTTRSGNPAASRPRKRR
jgi:hypothetical protein